MNYIIIIINDLDLPLFLISSSFLPSYTASDTFKFNFETQYDIFCPSLPRFKYLKTASNVSQFGKPV